MVNDHDTNCHVSLLIYRTKNLFDWNRRYHCLLSIKGNYNEYVYISWQLAVKKQKPLEETKRKVSSISLDYFSSYYASYSQQQIKIVSIRMNVVIYNYAYFCTYKLKMDWLKNEEMIEILTF